MYKYITIFASLISGFLLVLLEQNYLPEKSPVSSFVSVLAYSLVGTSILFLAYKLIDWFLPADVESEIFDKKNVAAAIFKGMLLLGVAIIISAVILAP